MAFILSSTPFRLQSQFSFTSTKSRRSRPTAQMSLKDDAASGLKVLLVSGAAVAVTLAGIPSTAEASVFNFGGERPSNLGVRYGRYLDICPKSPNCISSSADVYDSHYVPAWTYDAVGGEKKKMTQAVEDITKVIKEYPRATIIKSEPVKGDAGQGYYIYAEFKSKLFGFVDDVEFFFRPDETTVEYRSASRLGENDLDANRKRIRDLRVALQNTDKRWASVGFN